MRRGTPSCSMRSIASGNAASDDAVVNAMSHGSRTARTKRLSGTRKISAIGTNTKQDEHDQRAVQRADENAEIPAESRGRPSTP